MHKVAPGFWRHFDALQPSTQRVARRNFQLLKDNPRHPSLRFKRVSRFRSVRVSDSHRALAVEDGADFIWIWIGHHDDYVRMINR